MSLGNKALRDQAIPFVSSSLVFGSTDYGDVVLDGPEYLTAPQTTVALVMTRPEKGDVVEAYLFMELVAPSDKALGIKLGIGRFAGGNNSIIPNTSYTPGQITEMHKRITGSESSLTVAAGGTLTVDADITRLLDRPGDTNFLSDAFVLLITFDSIPLIANGYKVSKFKLQGTAQIGLGT